MRSDKMQMSYVPQCTEHVAFTSIGASATAYADVTVPPESIIEKVVVYVKNDFDQLNVDLDVGHTNDVDYFTPTAIDVNAATSETEQTPQVFWVPVSTLPDDRIVRFTLTNGTATASTGAVYAYVVYRFDANTHPTRVTNYA